MKDNQESRARSNDCNNVTIRVKQTEEMGAYLKRNVGVSFRQDS